MCCQYKNEKKNNKWSNHCNRIYMKFIDKTLSRNEFEIKNNVFDCVCSNLVYRTYCFSLNLSLSLTVYECVRASVQCSLHTCDVFEVIYRFVAWKWFHTFFNMLCSCVFTFICSGYIILVCYSRCENYMYTLHDCWYSVYFCDDMNI